MQSHEGIFNNASSCSHFACNCGCIWEGDGTAFASLSLGLCLYVCVCVSDVRAESDRKLGRSGSSPGGGNQEKDRRLPSTGIAGEGEGSQ